MKTNSLKFAILTAAAMSQHLSIDKFIAMNPRRASYNPGEMALYSKGNSGVCQARRAAKTRRNIRVRSKK